MRLSRVSSLLFVVALGYVLTACGGGELSDAERPMNPMPDGAVPDHRMPGDMHSDRMPGNDMHSESTPVVEGARRIEVAATSFAFDPDELTVTAGEDITIVMSSDDILHDFVIDEIHVHVAANGGETAEGGLRADDPGEYTYYCTIAGHREAGMEGTLVVLEP